MSERCNGFSNWETYKFSEWYSSDYTLDDLVAIKSMLERVARARNGLRRRR